MFIIRKVRLKKMKWTHADMEMDIDSDMNKDIGKNRNFIPGSCSSKMMLLHEIFYENVLIMILFTQRN